MRFFGFDFAQPQNDISIIICNDRYIGHIKNSYTLNCILFLFSTPDFQQIFFCCLMFGVDIKSPSDNLSRIQNDFPLPTFAKASAGKPEREPLQVLFQIPLFTDYTSPNWLHNYHLLFTIDQTRCHTHFLPTNPLCFLYSLQRKCDLMCRGINSQNFKLGALAQRKNF